MNASKISRATLEHAVQYIGVTADITTLNAAGTRHRVKLNLNTSDSMYRPATPSRRARTSRWSDERGDAKYQRESPEGRRVHAVCWHGFRDFFRACFELEPNAIFRTSLDTWNGREDFETRFRESGYKNIGSQMNPRAFADACRCPEAGSVGRDLARELGPEDAYGQDEADGAACRAMATALASVQKEKK